MQKKHRPPSSPGSRATVEEAEEQVTGRRDRAKASPFKMESPDFWGLAGSNTDTTKISAEFIAPCYCITLTRSKIDTKLPLIFRSFQFGFWFA
ncbi:pheophorbide a oxygenase, chloroplastic-like isoform X3 [Impatiens glandulifera]|uniref:pheophorbide a oxygenase, chloroplastic-like isoform X3 n=1 Tax=Impatiens glandulifera TaxID=253017 RepID=UPI001FB0B2A2|nr:pheophorbide a oxygenase, chloroplastic-like isoform X3 [Impatiens glandulifera]